MEIEELRRIAAKEELSLNYIAKDEMITNVLANLQRFEDIILKGGTAINRVYLKNKRFSEDIDFDILFEGTIKQALPRTNEIIGRLREFNIKKPRIMKTTIRYDILYKNPLEHQDKIRIEFTILKTARNYTKKIVNFGFVPRESALLNVYNVEELIKQKIDCIINRLEGKDFFDLYYLLEIAPKPLYISNKEKEKIIAKLNLEEKEIKSMANTLNHYIPKKERPIWSIFLEELKGKLNGIYHNS